MEVIVEVGCGRCGKKEKRALSLEEAQALGTKTDRKIEIESGLEAAFNDVLTADHPDIVIAVRNGSGERYTVKHLDSLCDVPDAKRNKGCKNRVETLFSDIFMANPAPVKKKRVIKKKTAPATPEETPK